MAETPLDIVGAALEARGWDIERDIPRPPDALGRWRLDGGGAGVCYLEFFGSKDEPTMISVCADPDDSGTQLATMLRFSEGWEAFSFGDSTRSATCGTR